MALPTTNISTSLVGTTLGVSTRNVGELFLHENVNEWGFNCAKMQDQEAVWGKADFERAKLSPNNPNYVYNPFITPGYCLGYFRGYDHDWVAYIFTGVDSTITYYEEDMQFRINMDPLPKLVGKPTPIPPVAHIFKVEFARNINQFNLGTASLIDDELTVISPYSQFVVSPLYPPDYTTNGSLTNGEQFHIKVTHVSSPDRRLAYGQGDSVINTYTTPASSFTNSMEYVNFRVLAVKKTTNPAVTLFIVKADLYADYSAQQVVNFTGTMSTTSDYSNNVYNLSDNSVIIPVNTTPGTKTFVKELYFDFSNTNIKNLVTVGNTVYGKIVSSLGQQMTGNTIVLNSLPIES